MTNPGRPDSIPRGGGRGLILPILLIVVGSVLLLNNLGILSWSVWSTLAQLWPVILVLLGLELILGRRTSMLGIGLALVFVAIVVGSATHHITVGSATDRAPAPQPSVVAGPGGTVAAGMVSSPPTGAGSHLAIPLGDTGRAQVTVNVGAGDLSVGALPSDDPNLATADGPPSQDRGLTQAATTRDGETDLTLTTREPNGFSWPPSPPNQPADRLVVSLARKVPLNLKTTLGVGQANLDLRDLSLRSLDVISGVGRVTVQFPSGSGQTRANIKGAVGSQTTLVIPPNVGAYVHTAGGLVSVHLPPGHYAKVADGYQSNNYATAADQIEIYLQLGVGQVDVQ